MTCLYIALNPILMDSRIKVTIISELNRPFHYYVVCFHGYNLTLATVRIFKVWLVVLRSCKFKGEKIQCQFFCEFHCTHAKDKKVC